MWESSENKTMSYLITVFFWSDPISHLPETGRVSLKWRTFSDQTGKVLGPLGWVSHFIFLLIFPRFPFLPILKPKMVNNFSILIGSGVFSFFLSLFLLLLFVFVFGKFHFSQLSDTVSGYSTDSSFLLKTTLPSLFSLPGPSSLLSSPMREHLMHRTYLKCS